MIISMRSEGQEIEHEIRKDCIKWLTDQEFEYLKSMNDKDFYQWVLHDMEERFADHDTPTLEMIINIIKEGNNDNES